MIEANKKTGKESTEYLADLADKYKTIHDALPKVSSNTGSVSLTDDEITSVGSSYNKAWNRPTFEKPLVNAINPNLNFPALEDAYLHSGEKGKECASDTCGGTGNNMTVDKLLTPEALERLRHVCLQGTYWFNVKPWGYVGAYLNDGFHVDVVLQVAHSHLTSFSLSVVALTLLTLIYLSQNTVSSHAHHRVCTAAHSLLFTQSPSPWQIAQELPKKFPRIFGNYRLQQIWAYKYDSAMEGEGSAWRRLHVVTGVTRQAWLCMLTMLR